MSSIVGTLCLVAAAVAMFVAGCSSADTKNEYFDAVTEVRANASDTFNQIVSATSGDKQEMVEQLEAGEAALEEGVRNLEAVDVPEEAEARHSELVADLTELRKLFAKAADKARKASGTELFSVISDLASEGRVIGRQIDDALTRIRTDLDAD